MGVYEKVTVHCDDVWLNDNPLLVHADAYSDDPGPLIPKEVGRLFRLKAATCSDGIRHPVGAKRRWVF
ncbi:MAG TPA: hypothetical protein VEM15_12715 [Thermodesulfobacteriota bacterium]|nr:hypothetical protein [Thermodesulfobacteriota bacterium]